jgi:hypothetical protein
MAVDMAQIDQFAPAPALTTFGELMQILDIVSTTSQMPQATSQAESCHMRLASRKRQSNIGISSLPPDMVPSLSPVKQSKLIILVSFYPCISPSQPITIQELDSDEQIVMANFSSVD